jgi:choline-sulfatase
MARTSSPRHRTARRPGLARLALLTAALAAGCGRPPGAGIELAEGTPVILVSIDTLRADRLPAYGYAGVATPAIDRLAKEAVLFEQAFSHTPLTLPSHVSMLAGELPSVHGVRDNVGYRWDAGGRFYLPAALEAAGYRTAATVSSAALRRATGLAAGFELYDDAVDVEPGREVAGAERPGPRTLEAARAWLRTVGDEPFFLFFHLYEPHAPYSPPEPFASRYPSRYDGEVAAADRYVGELFDELRRLDAWERSLVVLVSDHGEGLGDHGEQGHGLFVYREALHVPLLVKLPGGRLGGRRVAAPAQHVDLVPTVASLLGLETPAGLPGRSLLELEEEGDAAERVIYAETFFPRIHFGWSPLLSAIRFPYHLIHGPDPELYHLGRDPGRRRTWSTRSAGCTPR